MTYDSFRNINDTGSFNKSSTIVSTIRSNVGCNIYSNTNNSAISNQIYLSQQYETFVKILSNQYELIFIQFLDQISGKNEHERTIQNQFNLTVSALNLLHISKTIICNFENIMNKNDITILTVS